MSSSTSPKLLRGAADPKDFCKVCHEGGYGRVTRSPVLARPGHDHREPKNGKNGKDGKK